MEWSECIDELEKIDKKINKLIKKRDKIWYEWEHSPNTSKVTK